MKIAVLSTNGRLHSTRRLMAAGRERGHEVNSSPGREGIEKETEKDLAAIVIRFREKDARPGRTRFRGKG